MELLRRILGALPDAAWLRRQLTADAEYVHDVRHAIRLLGGQPGFAATAILTLAIGIGANAAIFTLVDAVLIRPLPYIGADRVVTLWERRSGVRDEVAPGNFVEWRARARSFEHIAAADPYAYDYTDGPEPESLPAVRVTEGFFLAAGARPVLGRTFEVSDYKPGSENVAVLSYALWQHLFAGEPSAIGRTLRLDGQPFTVIGVMSPQFSLRLLPTAGERGIWTPKILQDFELRTRAGGYWNAIARLKPGVSLAAAQGELANISAELAREFPRTNTAIFAEAITLRQHLSGDVRLPFLTMLGAVAVVLAIACANVSALILARGVRRVREFAIRTALGAARARIMRQLIAEAVLLASGAAAAGLALAHASLRVIVSLAPAGMPIADAAIDRRVLAFTIAVTGLTAVLVALAPAVRLSSARAEGAMRDRSATGGSTRRRGRAALIVGEVALAVVLLVSAGLLIRSFTRLVSVDPGFVRDNVAVLQVFVYDRHETPDQKRAFFASATERLQRVPGVRAVGAVSALPFIPANIGIRRSFTIHGRPAPLPAEQPIAYFTIATPAYFDVLRIPILTGRMFSETDRPNAPRVVAINETLRRRYWQNADAVGRRLTMSFDGKPTDLEIVAVVGDLRHDGFDRAARSELFVPFAQQPFGSMTFVVRTDRDAASAIPDLKRQIWAVDPIQTFYQTTTMEALAADSVAARRFSATLIASFAFIALALAATGIYALISMSTAQRTQEIGVRMALGADRGSILRLVVSEGLALTFAGLLLGAFAALGVTRFLRTLLFDVTPADPVTFAATTALLAVVGALACYVPARRATRVDPVTALRSD